MITQSSNTLSRIQLPLLLAVLMLSSHALARESAVSASCDAFFPAAGEPWPEQSAEQAGMSENALKVAVQYALDQETTVPRDQALASALGFAREPMNDLIGPTTTHAGSVGLIILGGRVVTSWGDPSRVDMTHSITKSLLSTVAAAAVDSGRIRDVDDRVADYVDGPWFESDHNSSITWDHLLRQTSSWEGTLFGKPDWADRPVAEDRYQWPQRELPEPGTVYKYNDVRVNMLALALLHVWREPLPVVLREHIMNPIGASGSWQWHGYSTSWVRIDGRDIQSVSGGGHWGGGVFINAWDQARFGYLVLRRGCWNGTQVFSDSWYDYASTPGEANPGYGVMNWFLNTDRKLLPAAPEAAITHLGAGTNMVYVDPDNDLVIVARWIKRDALNGLVERVIDAIGD